MTADPRWTPETEEATAREIAAVDRQRCDTVDEVWRSYREQATSALAVLADAGLLLPPRGERIAETVARQRKLVQEAEAQVVSLTTERDRLREDRDEARAECEEHNEWAVALASALDVPDDLDPYFGIDRMAREQVRFLCETDAQIAQLLAHEEIRARAIRDHQRRLIAADKLAQDYVRVMAERDALAARLERAEQGRDALRPVAEAAVAYVTDEDPTQAQVEALVHAVDVMPWDAYQAAPSTSEPALDPQVAAVLDDTVQAWEAQRDQARHAPDDPR